MKFSCDSQTLQKGIGIVEKAISSRTTVPVMENIFFDIRDHQLRLRGNDLEIGIETSIPIESLGQNGSFLIKGKTISSIVSKIYNQPLNISVNDSNKVIIKTDHVDFDIHGTSVEEYPAFPNIEEGTRLSFSSADLRGLIKNTIFSVSFDETKQFLNGVYIKNEQDYIYFVSTDGYRLSLRRMQIAKPDKDFAVIVPYKALNELYKILQQVDAETKVDVTISASQISFLMPNFVLVARLVQGQFPDYRQVIPSSSENVLTLSRRTFIDASERAYIIASSSNNVVRLSFSDAELTLKANSPTLGDFKETVEITRQKGSLHANIAFNVRLILEAIKNIETDLIQIEFNGELSPCIIRPLQDDDYTYIIMPIRTSDYHQST